ncbi:hypothetical protein PSEUDO8Z_60291 [Pseudomonas sp. 8Z]|nr:hypothetical protein PSEUDO8Z_60291 [Pseudomonas sp. 8Z]
MVQIVLVLTAPPDHPVIPAPTEGARLGAFVVLAGRQNVGWVERSETHRLWVLGFRCALSRLLAF